MRIPLLFVIASFITCDQLRDLFDTQLQLNTDLKLNNEEREEYFENFKTNYLKKNKQLNSVQIDKLFKESRPAILQSFVNELNSNPSKLWVAEKSPRFDKATIKDAKILMGTRLDPYIPLEEKTTSFKTTTALPDYFNSVDRWKECPSIGTIRDQSGCGSCWAFASTEAFNDRLCISSKGQFKQLLSPQHTTSCCNAIQCFSFGCNGGQPTNAWRWFSKHGVVTGGDYDSRGKGNTCWPYQLPPCNHHSNNDNLMPCSGGEKTPSCLRECSENNYLTKFREDIYRANSAYSISGINKIKREIYENGPVTAAFRVHEDFLAYKSGIYEHTSGQFLGGHAIKMIGWGVEDNIDYWILANSWNNNWGENGFFKVRFGDSGIESMISAGDVIFADAKKRRHSDIDDINDDENVVIS